MSILDVVNAFANENQEKSKFDKEFDEINREIDQLDKKLSKDRSAANQAAQKKETKI